VAGAGVRDPLMLEHLDPTLALVVGGGGGGGGGHTTSTSSTRGEKRKGDDADQPSSKK
jgi:hypothetical protein